MNQPLRVALIYGSVRPDRFCDTVAGWVVSEMASNSDFELTVFDPRPDWPQVDERRFRRCIEAADAIVIVTPEYNRSYPGPLKVLIDTASSEWNGKAVAFVSYGGVSGGLRAVEHLRNVFTELRAVTIRDCVSFHNPWEAFAQGVPVERARYARALNTLLSQLAWWAGALKAAREADAYGVAA
ncbi:NADPH-dependent FMN reductase [Sphingosinicella sp. CPCC 101087]|uniref:NADPH-dependent FMN reductase n=1 Tax=Sphingosinicella sp. CPCC 101087 TaxID=2497754 RepID=UPI00101C546B|nr:NAD(P)H-dependent oxidoreductase [Sphingosinicella sp. CPCC 101087]